MKLARAQSARRLFFFGWANRLFGFEDCQRQAQSGLTWRYGQRFEQKILRLASGRRLVAPHPG
jgi:hypothetical protein